MTRLIFLLAGLSLAFSVAAAGVWVRSYWRADTTTLAAPPRRCVFQSDSGRFVFYVTGYPAVPGTPRWESWQAAGWLAREPLAPGVVARRAAWNGFGYFSGWTPDRRPIPSGRFGRATFRQVFAPAWAVVLLAALPPAWWFPPLWRARRARRRGARGLCAACAYDLSGNASGVCPECGTATGRGP